MEKDLNKIETQVQPTYKKIAHNSIIAFFAILPVLGGFYLLLRFLSSLGRADIFQLMISDSLTAIMISIAYFIYIMVILYIVYIPAIIFYLYFYLYKFKTPKKDLTSLPVFSLISYNFISSLALLFSLFLVSYLSFKLNVKIFIIYAFIPYLIVLIIATLSLKKIEFIFIIATSSVPSIFPITLILNFILDSGTIKSLIALFAFSILLVTITFISLYSTYKKSLKSCLILIGIAYIIVSTFVFSCIPNVFYKAFEVVNIIDKNKYDLIVNKIDYPFDVFNDNEWQIDLSSKDDHVYHVKGEKLFSLSKNVLFCPLGTFEVLKDSAIYDFDNFETKASSQELKFKANKCILLDATKVIFHKLL